VRVWYSSTLAGPWTRTACVGASVFIRPTRAGGVEPFAGVRGGVSGLRPRARAPGPNREAGDSPMVDAQTALVLNGLPDGVQLCAPAIAVSVPRHHAHDGAAQRGAARTAARVYHLGVVRTSPAIWSFAPRSSADARYFTVVADSGRVGVTKPDARLFQHASRGPA